MNEVDELVQSRNRRLLSGIVTSFLSRGVSALAPLMVVPLMLGEIGLNGYGAWSAATALTAVLVFADLGLGVGLMTRLSAAFAAEDRLRARALVATSYVILGVLAAVLVLSLWASSLVVDWGLVLGAERDNPLVTTIALVVFSAFIVNVPVSLIVRIQYATGQMGRSNLWQSAAGVMLLLSAFGVSVIDAPKETIVVVVAAAPVAVGIVNTLFFFVRGPGSEFAPTLAAANIADARHLSSLGAKYLAVSVLMAVSVSTDPWVIAQAVSLEASATYAIPARVFGLLGILVSILSVPLWPTNVEALQRGDVAWVRRSTARMTALIVGAVAVAGSLGVLLGPLAISIWLGGLLVPSLPLVLGLSLWALIQAACAPAFMVQNAVEVLRPQLVGYSALLVIIPVKWWAVGVLGTDVLPYISTLGYLLFVVPAAVIGYRFSIMMCSGGRG